MFYAVLKKELINFIRDKKSLISFFLIPIIMYVYMFNIQGAINKMAEGASKDSSKFKFKIVVQKDEATNPLVQKIKTMDKNMKIVIEDTKAINEEFDLVLEFPKGFSKALKLGQPIELITYRKTTDIMDENYTKIEKIIQDYESELVASTLISKGIDIKILDSYSAKKVNVSKVTEEQAGFFYVLPMCILLFPLSIGMQVVIEICVTEKERGTLEALMLTKAKRSIIIGAKYTALLVIVLAEILISLGAFIITSKAVKTDLINISTLNAANISIMLLMIILTYIGISLIQFMIGLYAKNFKEAQAYMTAVLFLVIILNYLFFFIDIKNLSYVFLNIPIVNSIAILNEILLGILNMKHLIIVGAWLIIYIVALAFMAVKVVFVESVLLRR
ncbi:ABC transporter permease [Clostridium sp. FP1]|uniref:ABC transporter permease n=1 Tax=Clostridium sp. FP1 TaxID=2724076 RepID=UPI0013E99009|nr:ABC transporter permease [Clostridium sp. FP1]MBZ9634399.1 ABC transporter permease [Clostridium sp. FP1]